MVACLGRIRGTGFLGSILPRVHAFVPVGTVLEFAPGFGRWTRFLGPLCDRMVLVDFSERCIDGCRERFGDEQSIVENPDFMAEALQIARWAPLYTRSGSLP